jgi:hypothetical protein
MTLLNAIMNCLKFPFKTCTQFYENKFLISKDLILYVVKATSV